MFFQILIGLCEGTFLAYAKGLMQFKFFSPYKVCYTFGIINGIIILIIYFIVSEFKCKKESLFCKVKYNDEFYFDNIFAIIHGYNIGQIFLLIGLGICLGIARLIFNIIINYYSVCHIFVFLQNKGITDSFNLELDKKKSIFYHLLIQFTYIISFFFSFVFLEMIELNFWGLSKNLKKNIQKRVDEENRLTIKLDAGHGNEESENDDDELENNNYSNISQE